MEDTNENIVKDSKNQKNKSGRILGMMGKIIVIAIIIFLIVISVRALVFKKYDVFGYRCYLIMSGSMQPTINISDLIVGNNIKVLCSIDRINVIKTKKGDEMAFMSISDDTGNVDAVLFPKTYQEVKEELEVNKIALLYCKVENRESKIQCSARI